MIKRKRENHQISIFGFQCVCSQKHKRMIKDFYFICGLWDDHHFGYKQNSLKKHTGGEIHLYNSFTKHGL